MMLKIIEFCIAYFGLGEHFTGHFDTQVRFLAQFLTELLQILSSKTWIRKTILIVFVLVFVFVPRAKLTVN